MSICECIIGEWVYTLLKESLAEQVNSLVNELLSELVIGEGAFPLLNESLAEFVIHDSVYSMMNGIFNGEWVIGWIGISIGEWVIGWIGISIGDWVHWSLFWKAISLTVNSRIPNSLQSSHANSYTRLFGCLGLKNQLLTVLKCLYLKAILQRTVSQWWMSHWLNRYTYWWMKH